MRFAIAALIGSLGLDLVAHALAAPELEEVAHLVGLFAMVGLIVLVLIQGTTSAGDRDAVR